MTVEQLISSLSSCENNEIIIYDTIEQMEREYRIVSCKSENSDKSIVSIELL